MKIEGFVGNLEVNASNTSDILAKLSVGDILRAKVLNITSDEIVLKLFDGTTLSAKFMSDLSIAKGDIVDFIVKNNLNNKLVLETVNENASNQKDLSFTDSIIKKQLLELGIGTETKNLEIAKEIKRLDLPLNKEIFSKIADTIISFKNITPQKAAFLVANNIIPEEKNIALLNKIVDERQTIGPMLQSTYKDLVDISNKEVMRSISQALKGDFAQKNVEMGNGKILSMASDTDAVRNTLEKAFSGNNEIKDPLVGEIKKELEKFIMDNLKSNLIDKSNLDNNSKLFIEKAITHLKENVSGFEKSSLFQDKSIDSVLKNIFNNLSEKSASKPADNLNQTIEKSVYEKELKDVFDKFYVKIDDNTSSKDLHVKKVYKDMFEKLEVIKSAIEQHSIPNKEDIINKIDNLQSSIKFINDLNNHSTYIQIPLNIFDKNTTGELYVLKKGSRSKKIDPQNASVLISLNTQNLGQINSLISVNKKNISLNIRVEEQAIIGFIKENYIELYNSLSNRGYKLVDVKYRLIDEEITPINAESTIQKELDLLRQSIDYKI